MKSEILKIIEAGLEGDRTKLIAYANLLVGKCSDDKRFQDAIIDRITGEYKTKPVFKLQGDAKRTKRDLKGEKGGAECEEEKP